MEQKKYPHFLDNKPCGQDLFKGGSHKSVAQNIANVIKNNEATIIGIDGGWGSGKSNMVKLVRDKLDSEKYHFFIYDAWGHQEDLQRRSILEELIELLTIGDKISEPVLDHKKWDKNLKDILSRRRKVETKTIPKLSCGIILTALAIVATPILDIVSAKIESLLWKVIIICIPLGLLLLLMIILLIKNLFKYCKYKGLSWTIKLSMSETFSIYTDKQKEDTTYETISEDEPSSRKFRNWMHRIDEDLNDNIIVVVFDNMDRLPAQKVQELWASIHTFFADEDYNSIKVIIPFDREHIITAFKNEDDSIISYGNDFINKTFDAVYRVSPPIMSDWKKFFTDRWKDAFGRDLNNGKVTQIYDLLTDVITPREIIAFINDFVSIKQISDESIPDEYIALFIKGKDIISTKPEEMILKPTSYLGALNFMYENDTDLPKYISALYYQLPVDKALDLVFTRNLKKALDNKDVDQIKTIQASPNVFYSILENAITGITNIPNAIETLNQCLVDEENVKAQLAWDCVYKREKEYEIKKPLQEYQKILIRHISNKEEYLQNLITAFYNLQDADLMNYYNSILQLSEIKGIDPYKYLKNKKVDAGTFIGFVEQAKESYKRYKVVCEQENLDEFLSGLSVEQLGELCVIPILRNDYDLTEYLGHLEGLVDSNLSKKEFEKILFDRLKEIERPIAKKLPDTHIYQFFINTKETDDFYYDLVCMRISYMNKFHLNYQQSFNSVLSRTDDDFVEKIAQRIEYYINYGDILLNVCDIKYPLFIEVAKRLTEKSYGKSSLSLLAILQKYDDIISSLEIDHKVLINRLNSCDVTKIEMENINAIPFKFFEDSISIENKLTKHCRERCIEYLNKINVEQWEKDLCHSTKNYRLLILLKVKLQNAYEAFKNLLIKKAKDDSIDFSAETYSSLMELATKNKRSLVSTFKNIRDLFCSGNANMSNSLFELYGKDLLKYAKLEDKTESLRTIFIPSVLDKKDNVLLILNNQEVMARIVQNAGDESGDFKDKVQSLLDMEYKDDKAFESFSKVLGIHRTSPNNSSQEEIENTKE